MALDTFAFNTGYGLDPHDHSNHFTVEYNRAFNNGTHGIIFSRGCDNNVIRFNASYNNGTHGIVLDDGPNVNPDGTFASAPESPPITTRRPEYRLREQIGIVLDGGTGNTIADNVIRRNLWHSDEGRRRAEHRYRQPFIDNARSASTCTTAPIGM